MMTAHGGCRCFQSLMYPADSPEKHEAPKQVVFQGFVLLANSKVIYL